MVESQEQPVRRVGRYLLFGELAAGGMATVHLGRLLGPVGFARTVAIKRLHAQFARDPEFVSMFLDEARLAARIRHPNVVPVLDIVAQKGELFLVMDFVVGESLSQLVRSTGMVTRAGGTGVPPRIAVALMVGVLQGVHAAHETRGETGELLDIVHRDISPQNVLVGHDGVARLIDFGIAKAMGRLHASESGVLKGKLPYMAPEQLHGDVTRQSDIFSAAVVLWELLTGHRLFAADSEAHTYSRVLETKVPPPSELLQGSAREEVERLEPVLLRALRQDPAARHRTAMELALDLESVLAPASTLQVAAWVVQTAGATLEERMQRIREVEEITTGDRFVSMESFANALTKSEGETLSQPPVPAAAPRSAEPEGTDLSIVTSPVHKLRRGWWGVAAAGAITGTVLALSLRAQIATPTTKAPWPSLARAQIATPALEAIPPPPPSDAPAPVALPAGSAPVRGVRRPAPVKAKCDPPYVIDARGNKHFKPNCF